jgi:hypothetical protein
LNLKRNPQAVNSKLYTKDGKIYCKEIATIEIPKWFIDKELVVIGESTYIYGIFAIIIGEEYSVSCIPTLVQINPLSVLEVKRDDEEYVQYVFGENKPIIENTKVVKKELLSYNMFNGFYLNANVPWYIEYKDLIKIMDNLFYYGKSNLGNDWVASELMISFVTRYIKDKRIFHRQKLDEEYTYVDLNNVYYSAISTLNKLAGNYYTESLVSALVQKEKEPTKLENLVRS